jgi:HSP20 family protein
MTAQRQRRVTPLDEAALIEALFYGTTPSRAGRRGVFVPPTDVYETEDRIVVQVEIAGVQQSDFAISLHDRRLIIGGTRADPGPSRRAYHQMEINFGEFRAEVDLPVAVDDGQVDAQYSDGLLRIVLAKQRPHPIDIQE